MESIDIGHWFKIIQNQWWFPSRGFESKSFRRHLCIPSSSHYVMEYRINKTPLRPTPDLDLAAVSTVREELTARLVLIKNHSVWALEEYSLM